jgi:hypothetical protein
MRPPSVCIRLRACGVSQFPILSFGTRLSSSTPESPMVALNRFFTTGAGFVIFDRVATPISVTRLNSVRFRYGSRLRLTTWGFVRQIALPARPVGYMVNG